MRKKRAWSTRDDDAQSEETAAFEATVAAAKETAAKSDAFLSSAKSDLSDHQRWLKTQSVAVDRDRARHERWLERQRERRQAVDRKEHKRLRRQAMRERASLATQQAVGGGVRFVGSLFLRAITTIGAGIKYCGMLVVRGVTFVAVALRDATLFVMGSIATGARSVGGVIAACGRYVARAITAGSRSTSHVIAAGSRSTAQVIAAGSRTTAQVTAAGSRSTARVTAAGSRSVVHAVAAGARSTGHAVAAGSRSTARAVAAGSRSAVANLKALALAIGAMSSAGFAWTRAKAQSSARIGGAALATGSAAVSAKAQSSARVGGTALVSGSSVVASKAGVLTKVAGRSLGTGFSAAAAKGAAMAATGGRAASYGFAMAGDIGVALGAASKRRLSAGYAWSKAHARTVTPALYVGAAKFRSHAQRTVRVGATHAKLGLEKAKALMFSRGRAAADEVYGPHADGTIIAEHPANGPRTVSASPLVRDAEELLDVQASETPASETQAAETQASVVPPRVRTENALLIRARSHWAQTKFWVQTKPWAQTKSWVWTKPRAQTKSWARSVRARGSSARRAVVENVWVQNVWTRTRDVGLSQMMIIAGAVLVACGGLLLGGGLIMRVGTGTNAGVGISTGASADVSTGTSPQVAEEGDEGITWDFENADLPLPDRAVFTLSGTPESFRINGLSVGGMNESDQPLTAAHAILKPDVQRPDLKLTLQVDQSAGSAGESEADAQALAVLPANAVPAYAPFRLVFPFPPEAMDGEDGITVDEFFDSYGGLLLKFRYEIDGKEKSLIQYLSPELLQSQLDEVEAEASGS